MPGHDDKTSAYPWYDDRIKQIHSNDSPPWIPLPDDTPTPWDDDPPRAAYNTPQEIYDFLDTRVWRQDKAKKAAAITMYQCLQGIKSNVLFIGPTGCGKTHIWRCLQEIFPAKISIVDGSNVTQDGWQGTKKWQDLLCSPNILTGNPAVLVVDEADKMIMAKFSGRGENVSHSIQSEGLTILEGTTIDIKDGPVTRTIDTSRISFVLCGAFSNKAHAVAAQANQRRIGFGAVQNTTVQPYDQPMDAQDLIDFGAMPEFLGRIQRIVHLERMTVEDYYRMTEGPNGVLRQIQRQYGMEIHIAQERRRKLAETAYATGLGVRGIEGQIRQLIDDAIFEDCNREVLEL